MTKEHTHIYVRYGKRFGEVQYKCDDPDCTHIAPRSLVLGKRTICAVCRDKTFVLTYRDLRLSRPRCQGCSNSKEAIEKRSLATKIEDILTNLEKRN